MEGKSFHTTLCLILVLLGMTTSHPADDNSSGVKYPDCWLTKNECEFIHRTLFHVVKKNACQYWCSCQGFDVGECFLSETSMYKTPPHAPCWECNCSDGLPVFWKYRKPRDTRYRTFCHKTDVSNPSPAAMYLFIGLSLLTLCSISLLETLWTIGENFSDRQTDDRDKNNMFPHPEDGRQRISDRPAINGSNGRNGSCALRDV